MQCTVYPVILAIFARSGSNLILAESNLAVAQQGQSIVRRSM